MNSTSLLKGGAVGTMMLLSSCASSLDTTRVPMSASSTATHDSLVGKLDSSINNYRESIGKSAIQRHPALDQMAREHCQFMSRNRGRFTIGSGNISHYGFEERALKAQRMHGMGSLAENVAGGIIHGDVPSQLLEAWLGSKEHLYNLKQEWDATGLGIFVADDGMVYATQIFATTSNSRVGIPTRF